MRILVVTPDAALPVALASITDDWDIVEAPDLEQARESAAGASVALVDFGTTERGLEAAEVLSEAGVTIPQLIVGDAPPEEAARHHVLIRPFTLHDLVAAIELAASRGGAAQAAEEPAVAEEPPVLEESAALVEEPAGASTEEDVSPAASDRSDRSDVAEREQSRSGRGGLSRRQKKERAAKPARPDALEPDVPAQRPIEPEVSEVAVSTPTRDAEVPEPVDERPDGPEAQTTEPQLESEPVPDMQAAEQENEPAAEAEGQSEETLDALKQILEEMWDAKEEPGQEEAREPAQAAPAPTPSAPAPAAPSPAPAAPAPATGKPSTPAATPQREVAPAAASVVQAPPKQQPGPVLRPVPTVRPAAAPPRQPAAYRDGRRLTVHKTDQRPTGLGRLLGRRAKGASVAAEAPAPRPTNILLERVKAMLEAGKQLESMLEELPALGQPRMIAHTFLEDIVDQFHPQTASIYALGTDGTYRVVAAHGLTNAEYSLKVPANQALFVEISTGLQGILVAPLDLAQGLVAGIAGARTEALMAAPLVSGDTCHAIVVLGRKDFEDFELDRLSDAAAEAAPSFALAQLIERLRAR